MNEHSDLKFDLYYKNYVIKHHLFTIASTFHTMPFSKIALFYKTMWIFSRLRISYLIGLTRWLILIIPTKITFVRFCSVLLNYLIEFIGEFLFPANHWPMAESILDSLLLFILKRFSIFIVRKIGVTFLEFPKRREKCWRSWNDVAGERTKTASDCYFR